MPALRAAALTTAAVLLLTGCSGSDGSPSAKTVPTQGPATPSSLLSACNALHPGDPLVFDVAWRCNTEQTPLETLDCATGNYVHLTRHGRGDIEGIVGVTPNWLAAAPRDPRTGRTPYAFEHCKESG